VKARADPDAEGRNGITDGAGTPNGAGRAVEGGKKPVAGRIELSAAVAAELATNRVVVGLEEIAPGAVPDDRDRRGGVHDIREEDRCQDAIRLGATANAGEELLDFIEERIGVTDPREVIRAGKLHEPGTGNLRRDPAPLLNVGIEVAGPMQDQGRDPHGPQHVPDIYLRVHA
jgi:hypothetical protein